MTKFASNHASRIFAVLLVLGAATVLLVRSTRAQPSTDGDVGLDAEVAAVQRDVAGATSAADRAAAQAKLQVILDEKAARDAARTRRPATKEEEAKKRAELDASSKQAEAETAGYSPVLRSTDTGELLEGMPWNTNNKSFAAGIWWRGPKAPDGTCLAVWAGALRGDATSGAVLVRRFIADAPDKVVLDELIDVPGHGSISIAGEHGGVIELQAADGTRLAFDTISQTVRQFTTELQPRLTKGEQEGSRSPSCSIEHPKRWICAWSLLKGSGRRSESKTNGPDLPSQGAASAAMTSGGRAAETRFRRA